MLTAAGPARLPSELNTAVTIATPKTAPNCCSVFRVPEAFPSSADGAAFSPAAVTHGRAIEIPVPARTNGKA